MGLDESQRRAVDSILASNQMSVLTGGPGFGKTFTIQAIIHNLLKAGHHRDMIRLACPTGKAAKVLTDSLDSGLVNNAPSTIHRLLGCRGPSWEYNESNPLPVSVLILDESSMIDSLLMYRLLTSILHTCKVILVGDAQQLPPVGAGCPFRDMIAYGSEETVSRLEFNHRQHQGSLIADACAKVINGHKPIWGTEGQKTKGGELEDDLFFTLEDDKTFIPEMVADMVREWNDLGLDYCVLAPQKTGVVGVDAMNIHLQGSLNPSSDEVEEIKIGKRVFREGDKVLHTENNYELGVFNGFVGRILAIDPYQKEMIIDYDGERVKYQNPKALSQLALGYCLTVHKSQGSQYKYGVLICHSSHYYMWSRQLLYTAMSRFRERLDVVGDKKAVRRSIQNDTDDSRNTYLGYSRGTNAIPLQLAEGEI